MIYDVKIVFIVFLVYYVFIWFDCFFEYGVNYILYLFWF